MGSLSLSLTCWCKLTGYCLYLFWTQTYCACKQIIKLLGDYYKYIFTDIKLRINWKFSGFIEDLIILPSDSQPVTLCNKQWPVLLCNKINTSQTYYANDKLNMRGTVLTFIIHIIFFFISIQSDAYSSNKKLIQE